MSPSKSPSPLPSSSPRRSDRPVRPPPRPLRRALALGGVAFIAGALTAQPLWAGRFNPYQKLGVFTKVLSYIESHYVEDVSETDLMYGAARGLTEVLDPHSRFMDPVEYDKLKKETEGNEEVERHRHRRREAQDAAWSSSSPIEGSPAERAGIRARRRHQARRRRRRREPRVRRRRRADARARRAARSCW